MNPLSIWTYYRRHKGRAALLLSLSAVVTMGLYSMVALVWAVFVEQPRLAYMALSRVSMVTPASDAHSPGDEALARIRAHPDVEEAIPTTVIRTQIPGMLPGQSIQFDLLGLMEADVSSVLERLGATLRDGRLPEAGTNELVLSEDVAAKVGVQLGDVYEVLSSEFYARVDAPLEATDCVIVGIVESDIELGILSLEFLRGHRLYSQFPPRFLIAARAGREAAVDGFLRNEVHSLQTAVMTLTMLNERILDEALPGLVMLVPIISIVALALSAMIVVVNRIANARRLPEFGISHAIGLSRKWLVRRLTMETTTLACVGWVAGMGLSWLGLCLFRATVFAPRGYGLHYVAWIPIVFSLPVPVLVAGFTLLSVRRTLSRLDPVSIVERGELSEEEAPHRGRMGTESSPRPLAPATYYRRHKRQSALLAGGMSLMMLAVVLFLFALAANADAQEPLQGYLSRVSVVRSPGIVQDLDPDVVEQVTAHPAVDRVLPTAPRSSMLSVYIPPFVSAEASPFGVYAEDMAYLAELYGLELAAGHLPRPGTNEMVIPEMVALNRNLEIGDVIGDPDHPAYPGANSLPVGFVVSGIFARPKSPQEGEGWGFVSLEFLENHQVFPIPASPPLIVVPKAGQKDALDHWLENELAGAKASVLTHRQQVSRIREKARQDMLGIALLEGVLAGVAALGLAVLNYILISQRQSEFGMLHALGRGRAQLVGRVLGESAFTTGMAWGLSAVLALAGMLLLRFGLFAPRGLTFDLFNIAPWLYTFPIPIAVLAVTAGTTARTLAKLDPISIIERK